MKRIVFVMIALLPSCGVSKNPLSSPEKAQLDHRLLGAWEFVATREEKPHQGEYGFAFFGSSGQQDAPPGLMEAILVGNDAKNHVKADGPLFLFTTSLDGKSYLNLVSLSAIDREKKPVWDKTKIEGYIFARYTIQDNNLEIRPMSPGVLRAAIKRGEIKGKVEEKGTFTVTASTEELCEFIARAKDEDLFPKGEVILKRVK